MSIINGLGVVSPDFSKVANSGSAATTAAARHTVNSQAKTADDTTDFASNTTAVASLTATALAQFPSRQVKVEALRQAVSAAEYQLDSDKISESLVSADV